ncbi:hypothetical protein COCON_G00206050 [Conger conger]|uniref:Uncharacterized protein n=1 Tax=Conger conger TaxID=82655 RepID=A0A9Q1CZU3_CONCO|nr:hypothetical protein COCON_G00206050 [Conger conger]
MTADKNSDPKGQTSLPAFCWGAASVPLSKAHNPQLLSLQFVHEWFLSLTTTGAPFCCEERLRFHLALGAL